MTFVIGNVEPSGAVLGELRIISAHGSTLGREDAGVGHARIKSSWSMSVESIVPVAMVRFWCIDYLLMGMEVVGSGWYVCVVFDACSSLGLGLVLEF